MVAEGQKTRDGNAERYFKDGLHATGAVTVQRSAMDLYNAWRKLTDLPRFIDSLEKVEVTGDETSRWTAVGPGNREVTWNARIIRDEPGRVLVWRTEEGSEVDCAGTIRFRELAHDRGTEVRVAIEWLAPGGGIGAQAFKLLLGEGNDWVHEGLHRFRQVMETGEVAVATGQPAGRNVWRADRPGESSRETESDVRDIASS